MSNEIIREHYNKFSGRREMWLKKNRYYHKMKERLYRFLVPESKRVLVIGCEDGDFLASLKPSYGVGVDISDSMIDIARKRHNGYEFYAMDAGQKLPEGKFDYVIALGMLGELEDVQGFFNVLRNVGDESTCYIIDHYNALWEPFLRFGEAIRLRMPAPHQNWLQTGQVHNLLKLCGFDVIRVNRQMLFPFSIPILSYLMNFIVINIPLVSRLALLRYTVAKKQCIGPHDYGVSVVVPCRNEKGNVRKAVERIPVMGKETEIIFVDNGSTDGTAEEVKAAMKEHPEKKIKLYYEPDAGKKNAVIKGFDNATQEVLMILDADLTTMPEDLTKFFDVAASGRAEFLNGTRMVYPQQREAMRYLNMAGNYFFGRLFSYILGFQLTDTLCGTKVLLKRYWPDIRKSEIIDRRSYDNWGDFDLLCGAAFWNLKMAEIPVRYKARLEGESKMKRFEHGMRVFIMSLFSFRRFKLL